MHSLRHDLVYPVVGRAALPELVDSRNDVVALTFDDGPDSNDVAIAAMLREYGACASFFYLGSKLRTFAGIVQEIAGLAHEIGNHSFDHPWMTRLSPARQLSNIQKAQGEFARLGITPSWFRPPYGDCDDITIESARSLGMHTLMWTTDSLDWDGLRSDAVAERVIAGLKPGAVILMHSIQSVTLQALPAILEAAKEKGLRLTTTTEWFERIYGGAHT